MTKKKRRSASDDADDQLYQLAAEKLASSGLTLDDARDLGLEWLSADETLACCARFERRPSLKFNYLGPDGEPLVDWPGAGPFYRLRYLGESTGFDAVNGQKTVRYVQEPDTCPVAYYPQLPTIDWPSVCLDVEEPLIITEGELKAAKACKEGFIAIGLGGVWNFRTYPKGVPWIESLDLVVWVRRRVFIVFDSDYRSNAQVLQALRELAFELQRRGAFPHVVCLPQEGEDKVGLDDYLVAGPNAAADFLQLLKQAEPLGLAKPLWALNERYVYVADPGLVLNDVTGAKTSPGAFKEHVAATEDYVRRELNDQGDVIFERASASGEWLRWPLRREVRRLTYRPGQERFVDGDYNTWIGWGVQPAAGDVSPFLELLDHLFTGTNDTPEIKEWFLRWLAFPLQHPGVKMFSSAVVHGRRHGTGKSLIGYTMGKIYGRNFTEIKQDDLHANFNEWAENRQFVLADDVTGANNRKDADLLKKLITQQELRVNVKFLPSYIVPDVINYLFTSNQPDAFFLEDDDRRFFVHEVFVGPLPEEFYVDYGLWLDSGGAAAVFQYLLDLDLGGFNPAAAALKTAARERMITDVQSDLGTWVRRLLADPDRLLRLGDQVLTRDLYTNRDLLLLYDPASRTGTTANGLGRELRRAGVPLACHGAPVRTIDGLDRYYIVRNAHLWLDVSADDARKHVDGETGQGKKRRVPAARKQ